MVKKCCVCKRVKAEGKWQEEMSVAVKSGITHAYCPTCFTSTMARINRYHLSYKTKNVPRSELQNVV